MSDEEKAEVKKIHEIIEPIIAEGDVKTLDEFSELIEKIKAKHTTGVYSDFEVAAVQKKGHGILLLYGVRDETDEECKIRKVREDQEHTNIQQAELKEYLRLKKIYGKKNEQ